MKSVTNMVQQLDVHVVLVGLTQLLCVTAAAYQVSQTCHLTQSTFFQDLILLKSVWHTTLTVNVSTTTQQVLNN